jgi:hypothetical protein
MSKKVFIFGDCHAARIWEHYDPNNCNVDLLIWGKGGTRVWGHDILLARDTNDKSWGTESAAKFGGFETFVNFNDGKDADLIMPWLGYVDIRQHLPKYKNAEVIVKEYVQDVLDTYPGKIIKFIEPLPQFTEMLLKFEGISESFSYEARQEANKAFIDALSKECKDRGLLEPITQEAMYSALGRHEFTTDMTHDKAPHPVDGLDDQYNEILYHLFVGEAEKVLQDLA